MKYIHTNIISVDWQRLADFYIKVFECKLVPPVRKQSGHWLESGTGVKNAQLEGAHLLLPGFGTGGPTLEIYQYQAMESSDFPVPNRIGLGHLAFEVNDVSATVKRIILNGGSNCGEITHHKLPEVGNITFVYMRDPEGNLIEIQSWDREC